MILRRYGSFYHSVQANFNPAGLTEIGFQRDRAFSVKAEDFEQSFERVRTADLVASRDGGVQRHVERAVLEQLEQSLAEKAAEAGPDGAVVVLNQRDDWPKTRERRETVLGDLENRPHFYWWIDPPLRLAIYRRRAG